MGTTELETDAHLVGLPPPDKPDPLMLSEWSPLYGSVGVVVNGFFVVVVGAVGDVDVVAVLFVVDVDVDVIVVYWGCC